MSKIIARDELKQYHGHGDFTAERGWWVFGKLWVPCDNPVGSLAADLVARFVYRIDMEREYNHGGLIAFLDVLRYWLKDHPRRTSCLACDAKIWTTGAGNEMYCDRSCHMYGPQPQSDDSDEIPF
jgi:hypothetical protein